MGKDVYQRAAEVSATNRHGWTTVKPFIIAKQGMMKMIVELGIEVQATGVWQVDFSMAHYVGTC